jgi:hypothetical protein
MVASQKSRIATPVSVLRGPWTWWVTGPFAFPHLQVRLPNASGFLLQDHNADPQRDPPGEC